MKTDKQFIKEARTVLLIDDNKCLLEVCQEFLEAIEVYRQNQNEIDLVVLDISMPTIGGGEAYDRLKEINPNVKVLLSTGFSIDSEATEILGRGCNGLIQKPFRMNELAEKIRGILE